MSKNNNDTAVDTVADISNGIDKVDISEDDVPEICVNCGKEGANNTCNKCKSVKYCNAACKKKHKTKHRKACDRRVAELRDIELFKQPPPLDDCPICFMPLPTFSIGNSYKSCCGKVICSGCVYAIKKSDDEDLCPFCRTPEPSKGEVIKLIQKRVDAGDAEGINNLGFYYSQGVYGLPQDHGKALELWHQAAELGDATSLYNIGNSYNYREGAERDIKKAVYYYELAAMKGDVNARHNLGAIEWKEGNTERAVRHWLIAAKGGQNKALKNIKELYLHGYVTKDVYAKALRAYQTYLGEVKSSQRDEAAAYNNKFKYLGSLD